MFRVAQQDGLIDDADWYKGSGLTPKSDRRAVQAWLHHLGPGQDGSCGLPCGVSDLALPFSPCAPRPTVLDAAKTLSAFWTADAAGEHPPTPPPPPGECDGGAGLVEKMEDLTAVCTSAADPSVEVSCTAVCVRELVSRNALGFG